MKYKIVLILLGYGFLISYQANADREIYLEVVDKAGDIIVKRVYPVIGGYGRKVLALDQKFNKEDSYTANVYIRPKGGEGKKDAYGKDDFKFEVM
ncbi:MAG: hypothetical protein PF904_01445 [Kiritimatiellae bacterium]|jgi:hypothetical protein|nr:hypothetical protein [Kiritimatiellia bacterium]